MTDKSKNQREHDQKDARNIAEFLKGTRTNNAAFDSSFGVAFNSYMTGYSNGVFDTFQRYNNLPSVNQSVG